MGWEVLGGRGVPTAPRRKWLPLHLGVHPSLLLFCFVF